MKAILIPEFVKDYDELKLSEIPIPQPKKGEVLVRVAACGVSYVDLLYAKGLHQNNTSLVRPPFTLGLEFAGTVLSSRPSSEFLPGDQVFGAGSGSFAEYITVKESALHRIPKDCSFAGAVSIAANAPVTYGGLVVRGGLKKGETVLVTAAAGGLGLAAVQIAKALGARVIAAAGSERKLDVAKRYGADECVNYTSGEDWWKIVLEKTNGKGVDVVYDPVGMVDKSLKCLKPKGRIIVIGFAGREGNMERIAMNRVLLRQAQIIGYRFGMTDRIDPEETRKVWEGVQALWEKGMVAPTIYDHDYRGLDDVVLAMRDLESRKVWGKAVVTLESNSKSRL